MVTKDAVVKIVSKYVTRNEREKIIAAAVPEVESCVCGNADRPGQLNLLCC